MRSLSGRPTGGFYDGLTDEMKNEKGRVRKGRKTNRKKKKKKDIS